MVIVVMSRYLSTSGSMISRLQLFTPIRATPEKAVLNLGCIHKTRADSRMAGYPLFRLIRSEPASTLGKYAVEA